MFRKKKTNRAIGITATFIMLCSTLLLRAQSSPSKSNEGETPATASVPTEQADIVPKTKWQYGGFLDAAYLFQTEHPENHLFRSRGTTYKLDEPILNMAGAYVRKVPAESSRWGMELTVHGGQDSRVFGFSATASNMPGYRGLRHLGPANFSYLAPVGKGLTIQAGIFSSLIGYESLYAKDNLNYTRSWAADFTPYLMLGVNASYPFTEKVTGTLFLINGYWHLGNANSVPTTGGQFAYKPTSKVTLKQTMMYGPHQANTSVEFWRLLSDSIAEWKSDKTTVAFEYHVGTEKIASLGEPRALWMAGLMPIHYAFNNRWSVSVRPEVYWDRDGRTTTLRQTVRALTSTLEYKVPIKTSNMIMRLEHRVDDSRGPDGGFFRNGFSAPGVQSLTPTQNLLTLGVIWTIDKTYEVK